MKTHIYIVVAALITIISVSECFAGCPGNDSTINNKSVILQDKGEDNIYTGSEIAGKHLKKAGDLLFAGNLAPVIGGTVGGLLILKSETETPVLLGNVIIVASGITWLICQISGANHLKKAGRYLINPNEKYKDINFSAGTTKNGVGLVLNF